MTLSPTHVENSVVQRVGRYRLVTVLGKGGMGIVYRATDEDGHDFALKLLKPELAEDAAFRRRLAREVDTMRRVRSPHVAEVVDADVAAERPYIVTRFIDGQPLDAVVQAVGPLHSDLLVRLSAGLAEALIAIHEAGITHRDVKPSNVMLIDGAPVLIDFGIAHAADSTRLTQTGMFIGTPGYLGPEVIDGQPPGPAMDIYGWGATVAFAATGRPPFGTGSLQAVLARAVSGEPDTAGVPPHLEPQVKAALSRDPQDRPSATQIASWARGAGGNSPVPPTVLAPVGQDGPAARTAVAADVADGHPLADRPVPETSRSPSTAPKPAKRRSSRKRPPAHRSPAGAERTKAPPVPVESTVAEQRETVPPRKGARRRQSPSWYSRRAVWAVLIVLLIAAAWTFWTLTPSSDDYESISGPVSFLHILWYKIHSLFGG
ncbi:protein kinase domain-containing protein [Actinoallomurus sp. CA-150999]|uniref:serine/threonine-protein kinase n=1 Tax=Actinoallomurus sp. CA-150999 TaxID=3239887 RepID=UPI003D8B0E29